MEKNSWLLVYIDGGGKSTHRFYNRGRRHRGHDTATTRAPSFHSPSLHWAGYYAESPPAPALRFSGVNEKGGKIISCRSYYPSPKKITDCFFFSGSSARSPHPLQLRSDSLHHAWRGQHHGIFSPASASVLTRQDLLKHLTNLACA